MTGQRATLDNSTVCSIERALLDMSFFYLFIFIERNAVSSMNLNYSTCMKSFTQKIVKKFFWRKTFSEKKFFLRKEIWKKIYSPLAPKSPGA